MGILDLFKGWFWIFNCTGILDLFVFILEFSIYLRCDFGFSTILGFWIYSQNGAKRARRPGNSCFFFFIYILTFPVLYTEHVILFCTSCSWNWFKKIWPGWLLRREKESFFVKVIKIFQKNPFTARQIKNKKKF